MSGRGTVFRVKAHLPEPIARSTGLAPGSEVVLDFDTPEDRKRFEELKSHLLIVVAGGPVIPIDYDQEV